jgi:hypothetical protein
MQVSFARRNPLKVLTLATHAKVLIFAPLTLRVRGRYPNGRRLQAPVALATSTRPLRTFAQGGTPISAATKRHKRRRGPGVAAVTLSLGMAGLPPIPDVP